MQENNLQRTAKLRQSSSGMYRVLGVDKYDGEDWLHGEYETEGEALAAARRETKAAMKFATSPSIATVYYAYDPKGKYLGGDVWNEE